MYTFCVRAEGGEYADAFVAGGYVAIGWNDIEDLDEVAVLGEQDGLTELEERVKAVAGAFSQKPGYIVNQFRQFMWTIEPDDIVVTPSINPNILHYGQVQRNRQDIGVGEDCPIYVESDVDACPFIHRRRVQWLGTVSRDDLPAAARKNLRSRDTVFEVGDATLTNGTLQLSPENGSRPTAALGLLELATKELYFPDATFLEEIQRLLDDKLQVIFQGPPGTGKTFVARKLASHLAGSDDRMIFVQFHASYAYEDFVQGYRPVLLENGQPGFRLLPGPLIQIAERARNDREHLYFLVIDEINRGNLGKILGELYFLLEYRNEGVCLQYAKVDEEPFRLPPNLRIIGTMNTADRSIALIDLALRRRFSFVEFSTEVEPIEGLLRRWLHANNLSGMAWVADAVDRANEILDARHAAIGPSYFLRTGPDGNPLLNEAIVRRIWKYEILPYVEERLWGEKDRLQEFDLDELSKDQSTDATRAGEKGQNNGDSVTDQRGDS